MLLVQASPAMCSHALYNNNELRLMLASGVKEGGENTILGTADQKSAYITAKLDINVFLNVNQHLETLVPEKYREKNKKI